MIGRFIAVSEEARTALQTLGFSWPPDEEVALLGLSGRHIRVEDAEPVTLPSAPHVTWWSGGRETLRRWCRASGVEPLARWPTVWRTGAGPFVLGETAGVLGVLNVTPDSFSDGGLYPSTAEQVQRAEAILREGALLADIGAESTRPGHQPVDAATEWERLRTLLEALPMSMRRRVSVDTRHGVTARRAAALGVPVVNDISGSPDGPMAELLREGAVGYIYMYNRVPPFGADEFSLGTMLREMDRALSNLAETLGGGLERVVVDPGLGFAYGVADNLRVLRSLSVFRLFDRPLLVGGSRKRFVGHLSGRPVSERDAAGLGLAAVLAGRGVDLVRTHVVGDTVDAIRMAEGLG